MADKKKFTVPHSLAIIFAAMFLASVLTWIIPGGTFERVVNAAKKTVVVPGSFHYIESTPVNPLLILDFVFNGLKSAGEIIFALLCSGGGLGVVLATGMFQGAASTLSRKAKGREWAVVAFLMTLFALLCIPINLNYFIPFAALGIVIARALGYDPIVGVSIIMLGGAVGFSCGAMNLPNTGTAQIVAELPVFSGMGYRLACMIPFLIVTVLYVLHYGNKVKKDPTCSFMYGVESDLDESSVGQLPTFERRHIPVAVIVCVSIAYMIYTAIFSSLTFKSTAAIFLYMGLLSGIAFRMSVNELCKHFMNGVKGMAATGILIGFAYAISGILNSGHIMDTIVNYLAGRLEYFPKILQAPAMLIMHTIINVFVTSGSGQAAVTMPIFTPVADLVGMSRQTAVLAFNFGDGFCNFILPHAAATMGFVAQANIPYTRWIRFITGLFLIWLVIGAGLLMIATVINY